MIGIASATYPSAWQFDSVFEGMRNPYDSWARSDSTVCEYVFDVKEACWNCDYVDYWEGEGEAKTPICNNDDGEYFVLGPKDLKLAKNLINSGVEHAKFLRQLPVIMNITAPIYWWRQCDQYKVGTTTDSCSQMHTLVKKPFKISDFSFEDIPGYKRIVEQEFPEFTEEELENEEWVDLGNGYTISNLGRMTGIKTDFVKPCVTSDGYCSVYMGGKRYRLSRVIADAFCPKRPEANIVNHINGNKLDNRACNLEWVTQKENIEHSRKNNLQPNQTKFYKGLFTDEERSKIFEQWESGNYSKRELAKMWNVSHTCICDMLNGKHKYQDVENIFEDFTVPLVDYLNELRDLYIVEVDEEKKKALWYSILQLLPQSYNQMRTWSANYAVLFNICAQRAGHPLHEWEDFIRFVVDEVPYFRELCFDKLCQVSDGFRKMYEDETQAE